MTGRWLGPRAVAEACGVSTDTLRHYERLGLLPRAARTALTAGSRQIVCDGSLPQGTRAYTGNYVAHVLYTSAVGASELSVPFAYHR